MLLLIDTYFLQNIGRVLLSSLLQFSILYLIYACLKNTLLRRISAKADYLVLLTLLITGTGLFIAGICSSFSRGGNSTTSLFYTGGNWNGFLDPVLYWLAILYLFIAAIRAVMLVSQMAFPGYKKGLSPVDLAPDFAAYLEAFCAHVHIRMPGIMFSKRERSPFVTGLFRSVIIIPASFQTCFTPQEMEAVILHEMAHLKRFDIVLNILVIICGQLLFFNPFAVLLIRRLRFQREVSCDDWVMENQVQPKHYATALYKAARNQRNTPVWQMAMSAGHGELYMRIERLFSKNKSHHPYKIRFAPFFTLLICFPLAMKQSPAILQQLKTDYAYAAPVHETLTERPIEVSNIYVPVNDAPVKPLPVMVKNTAKPKAVKKQPVTPVAEEVIFTEVSDMVSATPKTAFVSAGTKRSGDVVIRYMDSVNLYAGFISRENVEQATNTQLESLMTVFAKEVNEELDRTGSNLYIQSPDMKLNVTSEGQKNLYFDHATVVQQTQYDAYYQQWKIQFTVLNGDQKIGNRYVTIYQTKRLQSARL